MDSTLFRTALVRLTLFVAGQHVAKDIKETLTLSSAVANKASVFIHNLHSQRYEMLQLHLLHSSYSITSIELSLKEWRDA